MNLLLALTNHLGNREYGITLQDILKMNGISYTAIFLERDEGHLRIPVLERLYKSWILYKKYKKLNKKFDIIFIHGFDLSFFFSFEKSKKILSLDYPTDSTEMLLGQTTNALRKKITAYILRCMYTYPSRKIDIFLPFTETCKKELLKNYSIDSNKIRVIATYMDLKLWSPSKKEPKNDCIFVGNNLRRKGGYFLLNVFNKYLPEYMLTIISMDDISISCNHNVQILKGLSREEILKEYQQSKIFLFPTYFDQYGIVITEAMACGIPVIMRDVGGGAGLVKDSNSGIVLPYGSSELDWAQSIRGLIQDKERRVQYGINARKYAENNFLDVNNGKILKEILENLNVNK